MEISEHYSGHYRIQKQKALRAWRRNLGDKATLQSLIVTLCGEAQVDLAERLKEVIGRRPTCLPIFATYLREYYKFDSNAYASCEKTLYRFDRTHKYVDLTLHEVLTDNVIGPMTKEHNYRVVKLHNVLNSQSETIAVLFEGVAGSGKTTMSLHICLEWAEGRLLQQFQLLILVQLSDPRVRSARHLADLIPDTEEEMRDEVAAAIIDEKGKGVCILLEGLDEAPDDMWRSLLSELIAGQQGSLPHLSFILTARPGCYQLSTISKVVIKGFDIKSVVQFITNNYSSSDPTCNKLIKKIESNPRLGALCSLPVNAATVTFLADCFKNAIPETQTGISKLLLSNFLSRHIQTRMDMQESVSIETFEEGLQAYPSVREAFRKLCLLSYSALLKRKSYFTTEDLFAAELTAEDDKLGLLQVQTKNTLLGHDSVYCFPHLSFQEFLAAVHLSQMNHHQQVAEIEQMFNSNPLNPILPLYAGLTRLVNKDVLRLLSSAIEKPLDDAAIYKSLLQNPSRMGDPRWKALALFNCLYECQDDRLLKRIQLKPSSYENTLYQISMNQFSMTPADCLALGYFVRKTTLNLSARLMVHVHLDKCSDIGISSFLTEAKGGSDYLHTHGGLALLLIDYVPQNESSPLAIKQFLQGQSNVAILQSEIGPGMSIRITRLLLKCITEGISANSSCCMMTLVFESGLSQSYLHYLILLFSPLNTLHQLSLSGINLQNGIHLLAEVLKFSNMIMLSLNVCNIDDKGLASLGKGISRNNVLKVLDVRSNPYTVHGAIQFLQCMISKETALCQLELNDKVYAALPSEEEYHRTLLHIIALRLELCKPEFSINPAVEEFVLDRAGKFGSASNMVSSLPPQFTRRESMGAYGYDAMP